MDLSNEITVKIEMTKEELVSLLLGNGFKLEESFILDDIYYVKNDADLSLPVLSIIKDALILRAHKSENETREFLTAKKKEFSKSGDIISQQKVDLQILSRSDARAFLKMLGYKELMPISADVKTYRKGDLGICIQDVNRKYLLVEVEERGKLSGIESLIKALDETGIKYDKSSYFVKKAQLIFQENYR